MDTRESLTVRTVTALQRLADLEDRGRAVTGPRAALLKSALRELETALEELRTASEQLNEAMDDMAGVRFRSQKIDAEYREFREVLPLSCILSDDSGQILEANEAAGALLNVAARHLHGKPLALYMTQREQFFAMVNAARRVDAQLEEMLIVRPRERKPRAMVVHVCHLKEADRLCWFFQEPRVPEAVRPS
jgi:PAS domain-containing protein